MSFEQALKEISVLVNDFKANEQHYLNPTYSEADVRDDFIIKIDKNQNDNLVLLVDQMLTAKKQLQPAKTESDKNYLQRKCDILDKQIDELACLTADKFISFMD
ncbi:MAG: hypothetical protein WHT45_06860 [Ignavibacterium sp.]